MCVGSADNGEGRSGFSLIELMIATAILVIITLIVGEFFQKANVAWDVGTRKVETMLKGRAAVNLMAREISQAIQPPASMMSQTNLFQDSEARFWMLANPDDGERAIRFVTYQLSADTLTRQAWFLDTTGQLKASPEPAAAMVDRVISFHVTPLPDSDPFRPRSVVVSIVLSDEKTEMEVPFQSAATLFSRDFSRLEGEELP